MFPVWNILGCTLKVRLALLPRTQAIVSGKRLESMHVGACHDNSDICVTGSLMPRPSS